MKEYLKIILEVEYVINLIILLVFYMHMFQLNSYKPKKQFRWMKENYKVMIHKAILIVLSIIFYLILPDILIVPIFLMLLNILLNIRKKQSKIELKYTARVKRMILTLAIIICVVLFILSSIRNDAIMFFSIISIFMPIVIMIANFLNKPIEKYIRNMYIKDAKKIIKNHPNLIVIGVTGSYGKTSVKNFLYKILSQKYNCLITPKNYNTTMGVVKTIRENLNAMHQVFVCEMGATDVGDIKEICDIVNPKFGIITSIGPQHLESFKSIENIIKTKFELADCVKANGGTIFLNYNNEYIVKKDWKDSKITYGIENEKLDCNAYEIKSDENGLHFKIDKEGEEFETKIIGRHNVVNLAGAIAIAKFLGIPLYDIARQIKQLESVEHRLQLIKKGDIIVIDDAYNSNPVSSKSAIDTLEEFEGVKILVTPGLIELGDKEYDYNVQLGEYAAKVCNYIFLVGNHAKPIYDGLKKANYDENKIFFIERPEEAIKKVQELKLEGKKIVLLENDLPDNYS